MKRYISLVFLSAVFIGILKAQTKSDSLLIVSAPWNIHKVCKGIVHKSVFIDSLYHGNQSINIIEISPKSKSKIGIAVTGKRDTISRRAYDYNALAAINGSYFNMKEGNSICYLKTNKEVIDTGFERASGVAFSDRNIVAWSSTEKSDIYAWILTGYGISTSQKDERHTIYPVIEF